MPDDKHPIPAVMECFVTGWSHITYGGLPSDQLRHVKVMRVPRKICNLPRSYNGRVARGQTCGGYAEGLKDSCTNDSGGSMACRLSGK